MKRSTADETDRTYRVESCEHGVAVYGKFAPTDDISALLKSWNYRGLRYVSLDLAKRLDALVAVCECSAAADEWLDELNGQPTTEGDS